jgi:hypothetical protein
LWPTRADRSTISLPDEVLATDNQVIHALGLIRL